MPRTGELEYYDRVGETGRLYQIAKPFSDEECGVYLQRTGALFSLLPPPPGRILECGCGVGWLAHFMAKRGYAVVATDVAPDAIQLAADNPMFREGAAPAFQVADAETMAYDSEFDVVVFFDSLHHSVDEKAALRNAFRALKPGGVCITLEPGWGHHRKSLEVEAEFNVTEKDMPPAYIRRLAKQVGFGKSSVHPSPQHLTRVMYSRGRAGTGWFGWLLGVEPFKTLAVLALVVLRNRYCGITVLHKPPAK